MLKVTCLVRGRAKLQWTATLVVEGGGEEEINYQTPHWGDEGELHKEMLL